MVKSKFTQRELKVFRRILFPLIADGVITGYNHYPQTYQRKSPYLVNYLHANLGKYPDGRDEEHKAELLHKMGSFGLTDIIESTKEGLVERVTLYRLKPDWIKNNLKLYDGNGKQLSLEEALIHRGLVIGEAKQLDWFINLEKKSDLKALLEIFKRFANKYRLDKTGDILKIGENKLSNPEAVKDSWEVPIVLLSSREKISISGYKKIKRIKVKKEASEISTLADKSEHKIKEVLEKAEINFETEEILANKLLYSWINE